LAKKITIFLKGREKVENESKRELLKETKDTKPGFVLREKKREIKKREKIGIPQGKGGVN